ncbi:30S ribosomal protein S20 [Candidatus Uhrbacteria bacterium]|nr:30S ribosomal protein S20 [Candidatus Uhrbacteria bacterium]MBD3284657.1 30S ribosomal protein S20 [Candidatus Uhrbacteria bacterium]
MPNKKAAIKDLRQSKKRQAHNVRIRTNVKHLYKDVEELIKAGKLDEAKAAITKFQKAADKAAKTKAISKSKADRKKSTLMKQVYPKQTKSE